MADKLEDKKEKEEAPNNWPNSKLTHTNGQGGNNRAVPTNFAITSKETHQKLLFHKIA